MTLITGAAGKTGMAIIRALVKSNYEVKALIKKKEYISLLEENNVTSYIIGNLENNKILMNALEGISAVYHICPNAHPNEFNIGAAIISEAKNAGVKHFVYHSVLHPQISSMPHHWNKMLVEEELINSGLKYTILQPAIYMQNVISRLQDILNANQIKLPYSSTRRFSLVDLNDIGDVVAKVILNPKHYYAVYPLVGTQSISYKKSLYFFLNIFPDKYA